MALGEILRNARLAKGYTPSQVAENTHLLVQIIENIEQEDFHRIAAAIYGRGFVKLYAEFLGLDPDPLMREFMLLYDGSKAAMVKTRAEPVKPQTLPEQNRVYPDRPPAAKPATETTPAQSPIATRRPAFNDPRPAPQQPAPAAKREEETVIITPAQPSRTEPDRSVANTPNAEPVRVEVALPPAEERGVEAVPADVEPVPEPAPISVSPDPDPLPVLPLVRPSAKQTLNLPKRDERVHLTRSPENRLIQLPAEPKAEPDDPETIHVVKKAGPIHVEVEETPPKPPAPPEDGSLLPGLFPESEYPAYEPEPAEDEPEEEIAPKKRFRFPFKEKSPEEVAAEKAAREERRAERREAIANGWKTVTRSCSDGWRAVTAHLRGIAVAVGSLAAAVFVVIGIRMLFKMTERQALDTASTAVEVCDPPPALYVD